MLQQTQYDELKKRIKEHLDYCHDKSSLEDTSIAWGGYIAALLEWDVISAEEHEKLNDLLPKLSRNDPVIQIFLGVDQDTH